MMIRAWQLEKWVPCASKTNASAGTARTAYMMPNMVVKP
eukprot:CAMPEP_0206426638 /NCGR_PEP_ID=MMETSP0324_2-20121206/4495_1 /ASSEMBLY_ACC=CAM_ASM_000836 /TAXON_ID=2866 /ORGANISM="Crypthecodinium cohnii, Strain Seligo" /LENGTH=38 /DNA_ID= /DNA_START= /DNA_END= /DNA_ORIENTATION=